MADQGGLADFFEERPGLYLEYAPVLSLRGLGVLSSGEGMLRDVGVTAQLNVGWTSGNPSYPIDRVFLEGVELGSPEPGESSLQVGVELEPSRHFPLRAVSDGWNVAASPMLRWVF